MADEKPGGNLPADNAYTQWHEVQAGESLSKIAKKYYGDASLYTDIFEANRDVLKDPDKIFPGQKLRIP
jgi:nucleoid-associated protein YgaU